MMAEPIVSLNHIVKSFGAKQVLKDLSFSITPGNIVGYIGPNGAGKSTTVKMMLGLLQPDAGTIELFGQPLKPNATAYKRRIGYVPESADVFDALTAREYLSLIGQLYGLNAADAEQKAFALAELVNLKDAFDRRISSYSKGMRQLVLIIASLLHDPDILFWDEPLNVWMPIRCSSSKKFYKTCATAARQFFIPAIFSMLSKNCPIASSCLMTGWWLQMDRLRPLLKKRIPTCNSCLTI